MRRSLPAAFLLLLAASWPLVSQEGTEAPERRLIRNRYEPRDREAGRYQYVPIEVAPGTTRLAIEYRYDGKEGANTIDLGLFEPGPLDLGTPAFRGWSGGERRKIELSAVEATPGYWPGPLPAGRWHLALGLYKVAPEGVDVDVIVETWTKPVRGSPTTILRRPDRAPRRGPAWWSGGLHMHTHHSDGTLGVGELSRAALAAGLDFIAITDHNNTTHQLEKVDDELLRIVGEEVTTPGGHASVWGLGGPRDYVDFRILPGDPRIADLVETARRKGALFSINHPRSECAGCGWEHAIPEGVTGIEISNTRHETQVAAIALWDSLLRQGRRVTAVGTSDWHRLPAPVDVASVRVWARELSAPAILEGIRQGRVVVMADGRTPAPQFSARVGKERAGIGETLVTRVGQTLVLEVQSRAGERAELFWDGAPAGSARLVRGRASFTRPAGSGYARIHVLAANGRPVALTNPVWVKAE